MDPAGYLYCSSFGLFPVYPYLSMYLDNNNLFMGLDFYDENEQMFAPFGDVTVNVGQCPYLCSAIDTNNNGNKILDFLEQNGFGQKTGSHIPSGFCLFPVFRFHADRIQKIDPEVYQEYAKAYGYSPEKAELFCLDDKITAASSKIPDQKQDTSLNSTFDR